MTCTHFSEREFAVLALLVGILSLPPIFLPLLGLEKHDSPRKHAVRWIASFFWLGVAAYAWSNPLPFFFAFATTLALYAVELLARAAIRLTGAIFPGRFPDFREKWIDMGCYGDPDETRIQGHPFLQFTGRIGKPAGFRLGLAYGDYGFVGISADDVARRPGVVRIACLGGSTTEYGYPALLEEELNGTAGAGKRFEVLNFGLSWWTTIHSLVNYVLNVRDFKPDIVIIHHNVNDHKYRGYGHWRGDGAHAFVPWHYRGAPDRAFIHFSVLYRFARLQIPAIARWLPHFGDFPEAADKYSQILQRKGKSFRYETRELVIFRRNIETILHLAKIEGTKVILTTMPYSRQEPDDERSKAICGHLHETNELIRAIAAEHRIALVDLEQSAGDEEFFIDLIHVTRAGDRRKASDLSKAILGA